MYYDASTISLRNALYHDAHRHLPNSHIPYRFMTFTTNWASHLDLDEGDRIAAEMVYGWAYRAHERMRPAMQWSGDAEWLNGRMERGPGYNHDGQSNRPLKKPTRTALCFR